MTKEEGGGGQSADDTKSKEKFSGQINIPFGIEQMALETVRHAIKQSPNQKFCGEPWCFPPSVKGKCEICHSYPVEPLEKYERLFTAIQRGEQEISRESLKNLEKEFLRVQKTIEREGSRIQKSKDEEGIALFSDDPPVQASLGMGEHAGVFYYGVKLYAPKLRSWRDVVIASDGRYYTDTLRKEGREFEGKNEIKEEFGLDYAHGFLREAVRYGWSYSDSGYSIKAFISSRCQKVNGSMLFERLRQLNKDHIYHVEEATHDLVAIYIMTTYLTRLFNDIGRLHFIAEGESGKSTQCRLIAFYCYNPIALGQFSEAYFYRAVGTTSGSVIIDDIDDVSDDLKRAIRHIDKTGYKAEFARRGTMAQDRSGRAITDDYFCPFVKNGIMELEVVSATRNFVIPMTLYPDSKKPKKRLRKNAKPDQELRDMLHVWAMQNWEAVKGAYDEFSLNGITPREEEIIAPLMAVAKVVGEDVYKRLLSYFPKRYKAQKSRQEKDSLWLLALGQIVSNTDPEGSDKVRFSIGELSGWVCKAMEITNPDRCHAIKIQLGKELKTRQAIFTYSRPKGRAEYSVGSDILVGMLKARHYDELLDVDWNSGNPEAWKKMMEKTEVLTSFDT